jgi:hypothetical protein
MRGHSSRKRLTVKNKEAVMRFVIVTCACLQSLAFVLFFGLAPSFSAPVIKPGESRGILELLLPFFSGQIGSIVGYYFGSREG